MKQLHKKQTKSSPVLAFVLIAIVLALCAAAVILFIRLGSVQTPAKDGTEESTTAAPDITTAADGTEPPPATEATDATDGPEVTDPVTTEPDDTDAPVTQPKPPVNTGDPFNGDAGDGTYQPDGVYTPAADRNTDFSGTLFIGNSLTQGFMLYSDAVGATYVAERGLTVYSYFSSNMVNLNGYSVTAEYAVENSGSFHTVFLMFGINELGWVNENSFYTNYTAVVQHVRETFPNAAIFLQSTIPVTSSRDASDQYFNNPSIRRYNDITKRIAEEQGVRYLDLIPALCPAGTDVLPDEASYDGIHLSKSYCQRWLDRLNEFR